MDNLQKVLGYVRYVIGLMYIALGLYLLTNPDGLKNLIESTNTTKILGVVMIVYGAFRLYRTYATNTARKK
jgi:uncharacterized membrane protein HdeD (DUF308 family)